MEGDADPVLAIASKVVRASLWVWSAILGTAGCNLLLGDYDTVGAGGAGSGAGATGGTGPAAAGLEVEPAGDGVAVFRQGRFRVEAGAASSWNWKRWFWLADDPDAMRPFESNAYSSTGDPHPITRSLCFWTATHGYENPGIGTSCDPDTDAGGPTVQSHSEEGRFLPVWYDLGASVAAIDSTVTFSSRVYPSGLHWSRALVVPSTSIGGSFGYGQISLKGAEFSTESQDELIAGLTSGGGVLLFDVSGEGTLEVAGAAGFDTTDAGGTFDHDPADIPTSGHTYRSAFLLGDKDQLAGERAARLADVASPGVDCAACAAAARDDDTGTYELDAAQAGSITFSPTADVDRFEPAFLVKNWPASTFALRLGDELLATQDGWGAKAIAKLDGGAIAIQYLGTIAKNDANRTFSLSAE